ncbi:MAG: cupin domain-containing protein [Candidatus Nealsonbacteria bacterium]|nr:cupin domain-containing protein [Candidatus Nealsonbacteria bacterium]
MKSKKLQFIIKPEKIKETFNRLDRLNKGDRSSLVFKKIPIIFFMDFFPGFEGKEEVHEKEDDFLCVIEGEGNLLINRKKKLKIRQGDLVYIPSRMFHKLSTKKKGIKYIVVKIKNYK